MTSSRDRSSKTRRERAEFKANCAAVNAPCAICGQHTIDYDGGPNEPNAFVQDHRKSIVRFPHLEQEPTNWQPAHDRCNRTKGAGEQVASVGTTSESW